MAHSSRGSCLLGKARVGLLLFQPDPNHMESYPNKLFEYMAAGRPVITSDFPFWRQFVSELGTGLMVDPKDPQAIAEAISWILDHPREAEAMGERGRAAVMERFTWEREADKLVGLYRNCILAGT